MMAVQDGKSAAQRSTKGWWEMADLRINSRGDSRPILLAGVCAAVESGMQVQRAFKRAGVGLGRQLVRRF